VRILYVTFGFLPAVSWGGPVQVVYQDAMELQRRGHQVTVCTSNRLDKQRYIERGLFQGVVDGIPTTYLDTRMVPKWRGTVGPTLLSLSSLRRVWQEVGRADVVHAHGTRNMIVLWAAISAWIQGQPLVLQPHGTLPHIVSSIRLKKLFDRLFMGLLLGSARRIIALQRSEEKQIIQAGGDATRICIVPNGLDDKSYDPEEHKGRFRAKLDISDERKIILFLGRINRKKGADLLVEAFARLPESKRSQAQLVVAGPDDGQLKEVLGIVSQHSLHGQVLFPGLLTREEVLAAYADADLFVLPCRVDTFPMVVLEACRARKPMVVTETCEIADILAGEVAEVVPVDVDALAKGMERLLTDMMLYKRYQEGARRLMETQFSVQAVGERLESIYQEMLQAGSLS